MPLDLYQLDPAILSLAADLALATLEALIEFWPNPYVSAVLRFVVALAHAWRG